MTDDPNRDPSQGMPPGVMPESWRPPRFPPPDQDQLRELLAAFGLPTDDIESRVGRRYYTGNGTPDAAKLDSRWAGYHAAVHWIEPDGLSMFSPWRLTQDERFERQPRWDAETGPRRITPQTDRGPAVVLRIQLWRPGKPAPFLAGWWHPSERAESWALRRLDENAMSVAEVNGWLRLLRQQMCRGRPPGPAGYPSEPVAGREAFLSDCRAACDRLPRSGRVTQAALAAELGALFRETGTDKQINDARTLRDALTWFGLSWANLRRLLDG